MRGDDVVGKERAVARDGRGPPVGRGQALAPQGEVLPQRHTGRLHVDPSLKSGRERR